MSEQLTIPPPEELLNRIRSCREEMAALRKLLRMSLAVRQADEARQKRQKGASDAK